VSALHALTVLAEGRQLMVDVQSARTIEDRIEEALGQPEIQLHRDPSSGGLPARGALARLTLVHLASHDPNLAQELTQALAAPSAGQRFEPVTLGVLGAVVLYVFSTEITLEKKPGVGWSFRFSHRPLKESTTGKLLAELFKLWRPG
jgi:hypothetical protein